MAEELAEAERWLRHAQEDLRAAEAIVDSGVLAPRLACSLSQQAAEKALKAVLVRVQVRFPRTHDLLVLHDLVPAGWQVKQAQLELAPLLTWVVEARYPGDWPDPSEQDARTALTQARAVVDAVRADLELRSA